MYPRLSTLNNANNFQNSTQWLVNGEYLKLRNLNVYYDLPKNWISKIKLGTMPHLRQCEQCFFRSIMSNT